MTDGRAFATEPGPMSGRPNGMIRRTTALAAGATLAILLTVAGPVSRAYACSCMELQPGQALAMADLAFEGVVIGAAGDGPAAIDGFDQVRYSFVVQKVLKGRGVDTIEVESAGNSAACGMEFSAGQQWRVFAAGGPGAWTTGLCSGNELLSERVPIPPLGEEPSGPPPAGLLIALGASALVALVSIWAFTRRGRGQSV
jgi:hypothetical protein